MSRKMVVRSSGGNLKAMAQRGARLVNPSTSRCGSELTFTTAPSISYCNVSRLSCQCAQNALTSSMVETTVMEGLIAKPSAVKYSNDSLCVVNSGTPCVSPSWYAQNASSRLAVTSAFFCRKLPAPALRGLTGTASGFLPAAMRTTFSSSFCFLNFSNAAKGMYTSPRTSNTSGTVPFTAVSFLGMTAMVETFAVTSSPTLPSPRVAACTSTPFS